MKFIGSGLVLVLFLASEGSAQNGKVAYPTMAPLRQYLITPRCGDLSRAECGSEMNLRRCRNPYPYPKGLSDGRHGHKRLRLHGRTVLVCRF